MLFIIFLICIMIGMSGEINENSTKSGRRQGGGYFWLYYETRTQFKIQSMIRVMIMGLLADSQSRVKKIGFIKSWAEKGEEGKAARTAQMIVTAQRLYNRMTRMYVFTHDNKDVMSYNRVFHNFITMKQMGMELDNMVQAILEYENQDPSGRLYGRRSGRDLVIEDE